MPTELRVDTVRAAVFELIGSPHYSTRAAQIADEIAAMPNPADVVTRLGLL
jgi:hypothetical protein